MVLAKVGGSGLATIASISAPLLGDALVEGRQEVLVVDLVEGRHAEGRLPLGEERVLLNRRSSDLCPGRGRECHHEQGEHNQESTHLEHLSVLSI